MCVRLCVCVQKLHLVMCPAAVVPDAGGGNKGGSSASFGKLIKIFAGWATAK